MIVEAGLTLFSVLTAVNAINVVIPKNEIEVARGADVPLDCQYTTDATERTGFNVRWYKLSDEPEGQPDDVFLYFLGGIRKDGKLYEGRVNFTKDIEKDDCSIVISKSLMTDSGSYGVEVTTPLDLEGSRKASIDVTVLVPPSKPICAIKGKAEYGQTVKLTCYSEEGSPKPTYSWESFDRMNQKRALPQMSSQELDGLLLKNLSADTTGFFLCTSRNKIQSAFCNITLAVMPPSMNLGFYGGIIGGVIAAIIIIGIVIYCCCCRDGKEPEDYEMEDTHNRKEYEEGKDEEEYPEQDSAKREYRGAYYDHVPYENDGENSPRPAVSSIGTSQ
ncbi:cell surface A33 antigen-like [Carcharodon carcharias]|uniref:cell surface A33 antigen-like n=1 Tax=Carcharodon carcharias TaxID=13397 RepID=UPI001B7E7131|nr:cell surface A33 antigen-like [Carcharodon carcharias]